MVSLHVYRFRQTSLRSSLIEVRMSIRSMASSAFIVALFILRPVFLFADDGPASKPTIAVFSLSGAVSESPVEESLPLFSAPGTSLRDLASRMTKAAKDPGVKAVVVLADRAQLGFAQVEELRQSLASLRAANKDVFVHSDSLAM